MLALYPSDNALDALDKRHRAMLLLLARLGLRAGEVFRLSLDHLDWTASAVLIRSSKTARERVLPMPEDVGSALAAYLTKGRPLSSERRVFLALRENLTNPPVFKQPVVFKQPSPPAAQQETDVGHCHPLGLQQWCLQFR